MSKIRLIDANTLKEEFKILECDSNDLKIKAIVETVLYELAPQIIDNAPTYDIIEDGE